MFVLLREVRQNVCFKQVNDDEVSFSIVKELV